MVFGWTVWYYWWLGPEQVMCLILWMISWPSKFTVFKLQHHLWAKVELFSNRVNWPGREVRIRIFENLKVFFLKGPKIWLGWSIKIQNRPLSQWPMSTHECVCEWPIDGNHIQYRGTAGLSRNKCWRKDFWTVVEGCWYSDGKMTLWPYRMPTTLILSIVTVKAYNIHTNTVIKPQSGRKIETDWA